MLDSFFICDIIENMGKENKLFLSVYNDYYGTLLTERQREALELYYDKDLSLQEISELFGISRQGVQDLIKRAEKQLLDFEDKLGLVAKSEKEEL